MERAHRRRAGFVAEQVRQVTAQIFDAPATVHAESLSLIVVEFLVSTPRTLGGSRHIVRSSGRRKDGTPVRLR